MKEFDLNRFARPGRRAFTLSMLALAAAPALAQWTPSKPMRLVSPYAAGGTNDLLTRLMAQKLGERLGQSFIVENRAGANAIIGSEYVSKAPADGTTLLMGNSASHGINPALYAKLPYDAVRDFTPIGLVATVPLLLVVHPSLPASTVKELVALGKDGRNKLSVASSGAGSSPHVASELLRTATGIDTVHVAYKGDSPALTDVMGGQVTMMFANMPSALPLVQSGKLKALAMTGSSRVAAAPNIPTMAEAGVPGVDIYSWYGVMAPANLPADVAARLETEFGAVMKMPDVQSRIRELGAEPSTDSTREQFQQFVKSQVEKYERVIKPLGIKVQ